MFKDDQEMKHKQRGSAHLVLLGLIITFFTIGIGSLAYAINAVLPIQIVQEKSNKCIQQQGEPVLVLNSRQDVKSVRCKKDGAVYVKF